MLTVLNSRIAKALLTLALVAGSVCRAQSLPEAAPVAGRSMEDLNLVGAAATMPAISDTLLGTESGFRRALFSEGILFRVNALPRVSVNLTDPPVPADQQVI